ncbi:hypothetical protein SHELI_v1c11120 [Spiroplasma helicoides]|uniref:HMA domain-containing protein n=1 Tax=Spiroplasma helicoides TaxID=216938 RepID=A0A1B3SMA0_9MOLU|nr:heavy-metal-associated domain-containing protein [Spiroplasma helicoides]AOG61059.1 hypothetical protein SHELI_v1c11120 [Spiroplasma helicoides]
MIKNAKVYIDNLECPNCAASISKVLEKIDVKDSKILIPLKEVHFSYDESNQQIDEILTKLKKSGFKGNLIND